MSTLAFSKQYAQIIAHHHPISMMIRMFRTDGEVSEEILELQSKIIVELIQRLGIKFTEHLSALTAQGLVAPHVGDRYVNDTDDIRCVIGALDPNCETAQLWETYLYISLAIRQFRLWSISREVNGPGVCCDLSFSPFPYGSESAIRDGKEPKSLCRKARRTVADISSNLIGYDVIVTVLDNPSSLGS